MGLLKNSLPKGTEVIFEGLLRQMDLAPTAGTFSFRAERSFLFGSSAGEAAPEDAAKKQ